MTTIFAMNPISSSLMNCPQRNGKWLPSLRGGSGEVNLWAVRFYENMHTAHSRDKNIAQNPHMN